VTEEHLRMANTNDGRYAFLCLHCGGTYELALPISIDMMIAASKSFAKSHRRCRKPAMLFDENVLLGRKAVTA
jgi:hypothetical protein